MGKRLNSLAEEFAATLGVTDPHRALPHYGVSLRTHYEPQRVPGKRILGAWDPLLRRIDLYSCDPSSSDAELIGTLAHEFWHACGKEPGRAAKSAFPGALEQDDEAAAQRFAELALERLGSASVRRCAEALRQSASAAQLGDVRVAAVGPITTDLGL